MTSLHLRGKHDRTNNNEKLSKFQKSTRRARCFSSLENCKNSNVSLKIEKCLTRSITVLKVGIFSLQRIFSLKTCCTIFPRHFIEFGTLGLNDELLEFLSFNLHIRSIIDAKKKFYGKFKEKTSILKAIWWT